MTTASWIPSPWNPKHPIPVLIRFPIPILCPILIRYLIPIPHLSLHLLLTLNPRLRLHRIPNPRLLLHPIRSPHLRRIPNPTANKITSKRRENSLLFILLHFIFSSVILILT